MMSIGGLVYAVVPFKTSTIEFPTASDMGKCPSGPQSINCMDNVGESPKWHYQDGGIAAMTGGGGGGDGGGSGTVTSVAMTVPGILAVSGTPITTSGTLAVTLATETANTFLAGPTSGSAATPTFRAIGAADLPSGTITGSISSGQIAYGTGTNAIGGTADLTYDGAQTLTFDPQESAIGIIQGSAGGIALQDSSSANSYFEATASHAIIDSVGTIEIGPSTSTGVVIGASGIVTTINGSRLIPASDRSTLLGDDSHRWTSVWAGYFTPVVGSQLTAASTITPTTGLHHVTGSTTITTIDHTNFSDSNTVLTIIADTALTFTTGGNIAAAVALSGGNSMRFQYDNATSTWYPQQ